MWSYTPPHDDRAGDLESFGGSASTLVREPLGLCVERAPGALDRDEFRRVMGHFATGVAVVMTAHGRALFGMTANSVTSVSLDPVILLVSVARDASTGAAILKTGTFVVNILREDQEGLSRQFAGRQADRFDGVAVEFSAAGVPRLSHCLAHITCRVRSIVSAGDHDVVFADVDDARVTDGSPLVFYRGSYRRLPAE